MALQLNCPCGTMITAYNEHLVADVKAHLAAEHPGRDYGDQEILMMAQPVPDHVVADTAP